MSAFTVAKVIYASLLVPSLRNIKELYWQKWITVVKYLKEPIAFTVYRTPRSFQSPNRNVNLDCTPLNNEPLTANLGVNIVLKDKGWMARWWGQWLLATAARARIPNPDHLEVKNLLGSLFLSQEVFLLVMGFHLSSKTNLIEFQFGEVN